MLVEVTGCSARAGVELRASSVAKNILVMSHPYLGGLGIPGATFHLCQEISFYKQRCRAIILQIAECGMSWKS
jgi:hypothetical protein